MSKVIIGGAVFFIFFVGTFVVTSFGQGVIGAIKANDIDMTGFKSNFMKTCTSNIFATYGYCNCAYESLLSKYGKKGLIELDREYMRTGIIPQGLYEVNTLCNRSLIK